jgi:hypothetical protein
MIYSFRLPFLLGSLAALLMSACGGASVQQPSAELTACTPEFPKAPYIDQRQQGDTVVMVKSVYVENIENNDLCWNALKAAAAEQAQGAQVAKLFFFDCPGHHPALKVDSTNLNAEYAAHCIATYERTADGQEKFTPMPFAAADSH